MAKRATGLVVLMFLVSALAGCEGPRQTGTEYTLAEPPLGQLPKTVIPLQYKLDLAIDPRQERFSGYVSIDIEFVEPVSRIWMHGRDLNVSEAILETRDGNRTSLQYKQVRPSGLVLIELPESLGPQKARLDFAYDAPFAADLLGMHRLRDGGEWYAFTQFEPIAARRVFPSFDEPAFKTPFDITVRVDPSDHVVTATPAVEMTPTERGLKRIRFARTEPLPTYLIAFAVGPFDIRPGRPIPANTVRPVELPFGAVAVSGKGEKLDHALATTGDILATIEAYLGIPHPYSKLDLIAVPDFGAGAMENVGAITFREQLLLLDDNTPISIRRSQARVMAHELAHMWFGNLVTTAWWDDIWLNEAFSTWMTYKVIADWDPSQKIRLTEIEQRRTALAEDVLASARQIRQPIRSDDDIENAFDSITYRKGAAVIGMFERYFGEDRFRAGIQNYLEKHAHGAATVGNFLSAMAEKTGEELVPAFESFLMQPGIPMVTVSTHCERNRAEITLEQERYRPLGSTAENGLWQIPVCLRYRSSGNVHEQCVLLDEPVRTAELKHGCPDWLMPNADYSGYYLWRFADDDYSGVTKTLSEAYARELLSMAASLEAAYKSGFLEPDEVIEALAHLAGSDLPSVATAPIPLLTEMEQYFVPAEEREAFRKKLRSMYEDRGAVRALDAAALGSMENDSERLMLVEIVRFLARSGHDPQIRSLAAKTGAGFVGFGTNKGLAMDTGSVETRELALEMALNEYGEPFLDAMLGVLWDSRDALLRETMLKAMGRATHPGVNARVGVLALDKRLRSNEIAHVISGYMDQPENREVAWAWVDKNFESLVDRIPSRHAARLPRLGGKLCDASIADELEETLADRMAAIVGGTRELNKAVERIRLCAARRTHGL